MFYKCPIFIYSINIIPFPFLKQVILSISIENKKCIRHFFRFFCYCRVVCYLFVCLLVTFIKVLVRCGRQSKKLYVMISVFIHTQVLLKQLVS